MVERLRRRLAAIAAADVAGYSRLVGADEEGTLGALRSHRRELIDPLIAEFGGRIANTAGDSLLLEFPSAVDAVSCALAIQRGMAQRNATVAASKRILFRIGITVGDVVAEGEDLLGDGVNVAARLQEIARPGGLAISKRVHEDVQDRLSAAFENGGEQALKNIRRPVHVWHWAAEGEDVALVQPSELATSTEVRIPSIAILPFKNISGDSDQDYFADGLTEDIITAISYWRSFRVIARNSSFTYKGQTTRPEQVAKELGCRYILEGSIRKAGDRLRINVTLVDTEKGHELWAERLDRRIGDIFSVQDEITRKVAAATGYQLERAEIARSAQRRNEGVTAWEFVAQGLPHFYEETCAGNARALDLFGRAIKEAPLYSDAWAYLAWAHGHDLMIGCTPDREATTRAGLEAGRRAVSLDENSAVAHLGLSSVLVWSGEISSGLEEAKRALELNPNDVRAALAVGNRLALVGNIEDGIARIQQALELNPRDPYRWHYFGYLARSYLSLGDPTRAIEWAWKAVQLRPDQPDTHFRLALCHAHLDQLENARMELALCDKITPGFVERRKMWSPYPSAERNERLLAPLRRHGLL